ncbi:Lrp/AsnC ligand binding domain-containing protein [Streptomyces sp. NBC_00424]|uniref:Lrp/AsnC ligand binding domain-containing protein n=1 Tax=Streptomyces sp. NBC_00424 TaxID=2903648 RepID=UPI0022510150|nr:Lrp/AsnC ligand binding domain-containing protein [Streptomyces sp. NBC_00424]MCX5078489.1 Lrp/AsnC ligand binding domain-containing protein [Streptomyces sp. NBC_00424]
MSETITMPLTPMTPHAVMSAFNYLRAVEAGDTEAVLRVVIEDLEAYEALVCHRIHAIPGITSIESSFAYGGVKQTRTYPRPRPGHPTPK